MKKQNLQAYLDQSYKDALVKRLNTESVFVTLMRQRFEQKEKMIHESLGPIRRFLLLRFKWRWLIRNYRLEESRTNDRFTMYMLYKGKRLLAVKAFENKPTSISFKRWSPNEES